jgi:hypothetical protein
MSGLLCRRRNSMKLNLTLICLDLRQKGLSVINIHKDFGTILGPYKAFKKF